jgi:hypothetical protein
LYLNNLFDLVDTAEPGTPPVQTPPINSVYPLSSPAAALVPSNPVVAPHYYPPAPAHHNVIYSHHMPPAPANGLYQIPP